MGKGRIRPSTKKEKICLCGIKYLGAKNQKYCSISCKSRVNNEGYVVKSGLSDIKLGTIGAIAELIISSDLMKNGFEVYRALSSSSYGDLIAIKNGFFNLIEIRSGNYYNSRTCQELKLIYPKIRTEGKKIIVLTHSDGKIHYINKLDE